MNDYIISCCSTADLSKEHFQKRDIHYICFHFMLDDKPYMDDLGESIPFPDFYRQLSQGAEPKTSQVSVGEYTEYFRSFFAEGKDILHVTLSSGISGTYNAACAARDILAEEFPERNLYIVDSLGASSGYGLLMDRVADKRDEGLSAEQLQQWVLENRLNLHHWFFSSDLTFFVKGGRVSKTAGSIGNLLNICPLLEVDSHGKLVVREKVRTKKKVIRAIVEKMKELAREGTAYDGKCYISQSGCLEDAVSVATLVEAEFPHLDGKVAIHDIGTTIGSHTGPGTVALFFWGRERVN